MRLIECRYCDAPNCEGCNLYILATMLHEGKLDCLMDEHRTVTIDPASLRPKGEWITMSFWKNRRGHHVQYVVKKCSLCNFRVKARWDNNFCPNCGADMRGE